MSVDVYGGGMTPVPEQTTMAAQPEDNHPPGRYR